MTDAPLSVPEALRYNAALTWSACSKCRHGQQVKGACTRDRTRPSPINVERSRSAGCGPSGFFHEYHHD